MTQAELDFTAPASTLTARLAQFFRQHPGEWIDGRRLEFAGRYAWRTRLSELRRAPYQMRIENRQQRVKTADGKRFTVSAYRFVPARESADVDRAAREA